MGPDVLVLQEAWGTPAGTQGAPQYGDDRHAQAKALAGGGDSSAVTLSSEHPHAPVEAEELIDQRIDYVLVRAGRRGQRVEVEGARTAGDQVGGLHPSDHLAVVCDLTWTG